METKKIVPIFLEKTKRGIEYSLSWLKKPHPFVYPILIINAALFFYAVKFLWWLPNPPNKEPFYGEKTFVTILVSLSICCIIDCLLLLIILRLISEGVCKKRCYWQSFLCFLMVEKEKAIKNNYTEIPVTYGNIYNVTLTGLGAVLIETPKKLRKGLKKLL